MKRLHKDIEALPSKRIYLSIIADYHLKAALCELIDNAIDNWTYDRKRNKLTVLVDLDYQRQLIQVSDNSGGVKESEINLIVSPGHSRNIAEDPTIGIFGVGSKRAVVALAEDIKIYTRHKRENTLLVEINDAWIKDDNTWDLPVYIVDDIQENSTKIELVKLRDLIKVELEEELRTHLGATYALFLNKGNFELKVNGTRIEPITFDKWSFPPNFEPKSFTGDISFDSSGMIKLEILGGLTKSGEPSGGEYGAYFYCNDRLITRAYKGAEVGYRPLKIGNPHPSVSLARVIIKISGPAQLMPWNSSKSEINPKHPTFKEIQEHIDRVLTHYSVLSKKWSTAGGGRKIYFNMRKEK
ncbi:ATP-binding protein [Paraflavitalea speifideaquila]|uniref:ATP-binding protein n=1 Tax=Paraflavitalea speifideaquila TaxID=3076558 RepID=UPI0028EBEE11|nr:ATP-binding protein [Paraflavitalea speifideiaquila]